MGIFSSKTNDVIPRSSWSAVDPLVTTPLPHPVPAITITAVEGQTTVKELYYLDDCMRFLRELQKIQMYDEGLPDISYNFYVAGNGYVYEGRGWYVAPTLDKENHQGNTKSLAIAYIRPTPGSKPTKEMVSKVKEVIKSGIEKGYIDNNYVIKGLSEGLCSAQQ